MPASSNACSRGERAADGEGDEIRLPERADVVHLDGLLAAPMHPVARQVAAHVDIRAEPGECGEPGSLTSSSGQARGSGHTSEGTRRPRISAGSPVGLQVALAEAADYGRRSRRGGSVGAGPAAAVARVRGRSVRAWRLRALADVVVGGFVEADGAASIFRRGDRKIESARTPAAPAAPGACTPGRRWPRGRPVLLSSTASSTSSRPVPPRRRHHHQGSAAAGERSGSGFAAFQFLADQRRRQGPREAVARSRRVIAATEFTQFRRGAATPLACSRPSSVLVRPRVLRRSPPAPAPGPPARRSRGGRSSRWRRSSAAGSCQFQG